MARNSTTRGTPRRRLPRAERYSQLLEVAEGLFIRRGFSAVTMEDICTAAGVSRPVVYDHLGSLEGAYLACVRRATVRWDSVLTEAFDVESAEPEVLLRRGAEAFFRELEDNPGRWKLVVAGASVLPESHAQSLLELRLGTIRVIAEQIGKAMPGVAPLRVRLAAHAISGVSEQLGMAWLVDSELSVETLIEEFVEILWGGLVRLRDDAAERIDGRDR